MREAYLKKKLWMWLFGIQSKCVKNSHHYWENCIDVLMTVLLAWMKRHLDSLKCRDFSVPICYRYIPIALFRRCQGRRWKRKDILEGRSKNLETMAWGGPPRGQRNIPGLDEGTVPTPQAGESVSVFLGALQRCYGSFRRPYSLLWNEGKFWLCCPTFTSKYEKGRRLVFLAPRSPDQKKAHIDFMWS